MLRGVARYTGHSITLLSLLLFLGSFVAWYLTADFPSPQWANTTDRVGVAWQVASGDGSFLIARTAISPPQDVASRSNTIPSGGSFDVPYVMTVMWFRDVAQDGTGPIVPYTAFWIIHGRWALPTLLFMLLPAKRALRLGVRWRRKRLGLCQDCAYDLRASPERCPECGAANA